MASDLYLHEPHKFADAGLQLRVPVDMVPPNQYSRLTNATPIIEGRLETRAGLQFIVKTNNVSFPGSGLHSLTRLNQSSVAGVGDRVAGIDTSVYTYALPAGNVATVRDTDRTGDPLSLANFHFANDVASWQAIADRQLMTKYNSGYYGPIGLFTPQGPVTAIADGGSAGNLNSTGGTNYDWVYTHVFTPTLSESNPSPPAWNGNEDLYPTVVVTPDPGFGGAAFTASTVTTGTGVALSATETRQSAEWTTFGVPANQPYQELTLNISGSFQCAGTNGCVYGAIYFSLDGGTTWKLYVDFSGVGQLFFGNHNLVNPTHELGTIFLSPTQDISQLKVRAAVMGCGNTTASQNVIARRIRQKAGNLNINSLLVGANGTNQQVTLTIQDIHTHGVQTGAVANSLPLVNRNAHICVMDPRIYSKTMLCDAIRLYRRGGSVQAGWAFVGQFNLTALPLGVCAANTLQITDNVADTNLGAFAQFNANDAPITSVFVTQRPLPYIWGPAFNPARMLGCGDPDRPDAVYFSNPGNMDGWGDGQWVDVSAPSDSMQNGLVYNTRVFAFSKEKMYELVSGIPGSTTITPFPTPCSRGLISPYGLTATAKMIYFVAKDGVYSTTGGQETSLVENNIKPLFPTLDNPLGRSIEGYEAINMERIEDIRLRFHNDELYFFYRGSTSGTVQCLIYNPDKDRWRAAKFPEVGIITAYSEEAGPASSLLLGDSQGSMYSTALGQGDVLQASTIDIPVTIRTGAFDQSLPLNQKEYGSVIFDIDPGGATLAKPITITPLLNGEVITAAAITVTGTGRQQIPLTLGDVFGFNLEFDITFSANATINPILYQFDILWRQEPIAITHWEVRETSHGLPGYQHIRDMYVAYRSNTVVTLTMTFDGNYTQTYTLPSTAGKRSKIYVPFLSNKFKTVRYSFDSTDVTKPFQLYIQDCEVRVKPWLTSLGYSIEKPFGAESTMATTAFESTMIAGGGSATMPMSGGK